MLHTANTDNQHPKKSSAEKMISQKHEKHHEQILLPSNAHILLGKKNKNSSID